MAERKRTGPFGQRLESEWKYFIKATYSTLTRSTYRKEVLGRQLHPSQTACREKQKNAACIAGYVVNAHYAHMGHIRLTCLDHFGDMPLRSEAGDEW